MRLTRLALLLGVTATPLFGQSSTAKRGVTAEDYFSFELVSDPRISPDGSHVVYVVSRVDRAQNRRVPSIWMAPTDDAVVLRLTGDVDFETSGLLEAPLQTLQRDGRSISWSTCLASALSIPPA